jgi:toxin-antitoxin system PIN domain toxin
MISIDTNLLLYSQVRQAPEHAAARSFLHSCVERDDVVISEFVLTELYRLLRNPTVLRLPLRAAAASEIIQAFRTQPSWRLVGFTTDSRAFHDELWSSASRSDFPYKRLYDLRLSLSLLHHGVTEFATANTRDFEDLGFKRVWNPLLPA